MLALAVLGIFVVVAGPARAAEPEEPPEPEESSVKVEITGIEDPLLTNVRRFLGITELEANGLIEGLTGNREEPVTEAEIRQRHQLAPGQIRDALVPFGYYRPAIEADLTGDDGGFVARYQVDPGEPATLDEVIVRVEGEGRDFPAVQEALAAVDLTSGQRLEHARYEQAKQGLFDAAYDGGFLDARWARSEIRVAPDRRQADVALILETGPRFYFGETSVRQETLDPSFVAGFVHIEPGTPYDVEALLDLQRTLNETDYFSRVEVQAPRDAAGEDRRVPVTVVAEPASPQEYTVGLGYGTDTGPRGKLGVLMRRVNDRGHQFRADIQLSAIEQAIGARYEIPIRNYSTDRLAFTATARQEEIGDADTDQVAVGASQLVSWLGFRRRLYVQAAREQFSFGDGPSQTTDLLYPGVALTRERADDLQYPRRGYRLHADLRGATDQLVSDVSFSRLELQATFVRGIAARTRLLLRADGGILWTDQFEALPPSQRFFAGGDQSIRGYGYRDVGPRNADGDVIGGERALAASLELEHLFYRDYGAAVFVDAGDAFNDSPSFKVGAGVGFRWRSPVGMVRLDVAHPFDDPDDNYRIHLTIGAEL